ncbi:helix-turn-helix domain-containing protein [Glycomyces buryatensis]|uniref:helix-turn-helix domain-containing protein n=1 Tax=Glycomyces buryatensis TaxID=2570927 RepID=UPI0014562983|nr:helix-turn-helix transcriptional regulator [Glycomyces buryatensis]
MNSYNGIGGLLRHLRRGSGMTLAAVASRVGCAVSQISQVETGTRSLKPWLAESLDVVYGTAGMISALAAEAEIGSVEEVVAVRIPGENTTLMLSRRQFLTAIGLGAAGALPGLKEAVGRLTPTAELVDELRDSFAQLRNAARLTAPTHVIPALMGQVAIIDAVRHSSTGEVRVNLDRLQARLAETLSWMCEEAGDGSAALFWIDRTSEWAARSAWTAMSHYTSIRRSMLALSTAGFAPAAIDHARPVLASTGAPHRLKALAAKQVAFGNALLGLPDATQYALDLTARHLEASDGSDQNSTVGQTSLPTDDLLLMFRATCDVYLGGGPLTIAEFEPRLHAISAASARSGAINTAKLARAYASAGDVDRACRLAADVLDGGGATESRSTRVELVRALTLIRTRWPGREETAELSRKLESVSG